MFLTNFDNFWGIWLITCDMWTFSAECYEQIEFKFYSYNYRGHTSLLNIPVPLVIFFFLVGEFMLSDRSGLLRGSVKFCTCSFRAHRLHICAKSGALVSSKNLLGFDNQKSWAECKTIASAAYDTLAFSFWTLPECKSIVSANFYFLFFSFILVF